MAAVKCLRVSFKLKPFSVFGSLGATFEFRLQHYAKIAVDLNFCRGLSISTWRCFILIFWVWRWSWHGVRFECRSHCSHVGTNRRCRVWWPRGSPGQRFMCGIFPNVFFGNYFSFKQVANASHLLGTVCIEYAASALFLFGLFIRWPLAKLPQILGQVWPCIRSQSSPASTITPSQISLDSPPSLRYGQSDWVSKGLSPLFLFFFLGSGVN